MSELLLLLILEALCVAGAPLDGRYKPWVFVALGVLGLLVYFGITTIRIG